MSIDAARMADRLIESGFAIAGYRQQLERVAAELLARYDEGDVDRLFDYISSTSARPGNPTAYIKRIVFTEGRYLRPRRDFPARDRDADRNQGQDVSNEDVEREIASLGEGDSL